MPASSNAVSPSQVKNEAITPLQPERGAFVARSHQPRKRGHTAATLVPQPVVRAAAKKSRLGVLYFGSTAPAMDEALSTLAGAGIHLDAMRLRAFPFPPSVAAFIAEHDHVFVVEQNRDAQMHSLLVNELDIDPARMVRVLHYDGTPITARYITRAIRDTLQPAAADSQKEAA